MADMNHADVVEANAPVESPVYIPVENPRMYHTARMRVGSVGPIKEPMGYQPVINIDDISDEDEFEGYHQEDILDAEEVGAPETEEILQEMEEAEQIALLLSMVQQAITAIQDADAEIEMLKAGWIAEAQKNHCLEVTCAIKEAEKIQLQDKLDKEKKDRCRSYWELHKEVEDFPVARKESGYEINRSVVVSMLFREYKKARK